ncbi:hypothetical protein RchiOBHm_Chr2g0166441 [Rosa chinensis]|uniref:Uncharacterized protein n=1 Tax=Rosa chinensis TaxID=74649 RepID=A0A2P6S442_ROSCH|nr:hypothetical protein RchiOBHm_Chr2g0166441 [Rosa chinensis]
MADRGDNDHSPSVHYPLQYLGGRSILLFHHFYLFHFPFSFITLALKIKKSNPQRRNRVS